MGIINAVRKTIAYQKRNGTRAAFFAALERVSDKIKNKYEFVPCNEAALNEQREEYKLLAKAGNLAMFSIVVPLFNTPEKYLREMIESVISQTYGDWELILADASPKPLDLAREYGDKDPRIKYYYLDKNAGISENTNRGIEKATGDYIGLLDHDDFLTPDALYEVSRVIRKSMKQNKLSVYRSCPVRLIYSDEDKYDDSKGKYVEPHIKPGFNMDLLLSNNYICHFTVMRADVIRRLKLRGDYDGAQDFDLFLRACAEATLEMPAASGQIVHIEKVLYHWRCHSASTAANPASKTYAYEAGKKALLDLCNRYRIKAEVEPLPHLGFYRINYVPNIYSCRSDVGCVGGKILNKKGRIAGGAYTKDRSLMYAGLPVGYSGGLQHRAVLQQDCYAVDVRCIAVREDLIPVYEQITGVKYENSYICALDGTLDGKVSTGDGFSSFTTDAIVEMSIRFGEEMKRRGLRVVWDPKAVKRVK